MSIEYDVEFTATWNETVEANSEEEACDKAWKLEQKFLQKHFSLSYINAEISVEKVEVE